MGEELLSPATSHRLLIALRDLGSARDVEGIMAIVRSAVRTLTGADGATFVLRDGDLCHYADEDAIAPLWKGQRFPMRACVSGWCMLHREQVVIEDIYSDARIPADAYRPTFVKSLAMVPIRGDDPVGAIGAYWASRHAATREEVTALQALADAAAASLIAHDVTARKRAEEAIETANEALRFAREELEARVEARTADLSRARRDLETLLYVAAHDLKEPLNGLLLCSGMLADRYREQLDEKGRGIIDRIGRAASRMGRLLDDLLVLTRANNLHPGTDPVPAASIVSEALERFSDRIRASGARINVDDALPSLYAHPTWAAEAVANLISNALKFTRQYEAPQIEIASYDGREGLGICVRDRGPGVPLELQERIFKIFQRGVGREVEGTGAGLAIVREIAHRHGGEAFVRTRTGGGSEFVVTFGPKPDGSAGETPLGRATGREATVGG